MDSESQSSQKIYSCDSSSLESGGKTSTVANQLSDSEHAYGDTQCAFNYNMSFALLNVDDSCEIMTQPLLLFLAHSSTAIYSSGGLFSGENCWAKKSGQEYEISQTRLFQMLFAAHFV